MIVFLPEAAPAGPATSSAPAASAGPKSDDQAAIDKLIRQLGDDDYKLRQDAQAKLLKIAGPVVRSALEKASASDDSEVRQRASDILSKMVDTELESRSAAIRKSVLWTFEVAGGAAGPPVVADGKVIFLGGDRLLHALDSVGGKEAWKLGTFTIKVGECDQPVVSDGGLFLTDRVDSLYAVDLAKGKLLWRLAALQSASLPCVGGGVMYVSGTNSLRAIDALTAKEKWSAESRDYGTRAALEGETLFVVEGMDKGPPAEDLPHTIVPAISALEASTGRRIWQFDPESKCSHLAPRGGTLYFKAGAVVGALESAGGKKLWQFSLPALVREEGLFAVEGDTVYATCYEQLFAIEAATGRQKWKADFAPPEAPAPKAEEDPRRMIGLAVDDSGVYVGRPDGLHALDLKTGTDIWTLKTVNRLHMGPAVSGGILYFGTAQQINDGADAKRDFAAPPGLHAVKLK